MRYKICECEGFFLFEGIGRFDGNVNDKKSMFCFKYFMISFKNLESEG